MLIDIRREDPLSTQEIESKKLQLLTQEKLYEKKTMRCWLGTALVAVAAIALFRSISHFVDKETLFLMGGVFFSLQVLFLKLYIPSADKVDDLEEASISLETFNMSPSNGELLAQLHAYCNESEICRQYVHKLNALNRQPIVAEFEAMRCQYLREQNQTEAHNSELKAQALRQI